MYKKLIIVILLQFLLYPAIFSQDTYSAGYPLYLKTQNTGMYVLGSWALVNIATGAYGWNKNSGQSKYFHQMNFFWNTVNLTIAGVALYSNYQLDAGALSAEEVLQKQLNTEKLFLINAGLDILYMGGGLYMRSIAGKHPKRTDLLRGYGNSVILQGAFLFVFDLVMWGILRPMRLDALQNVSLGIHNNALAFSYAINF